MARTCTYSWQGESGKAEWIFDGEALLLVPEESAPQAFALKECAGLSGDGYTLELAYADQRLVLQRLGQDGPTLLESLWRTWPPTRAEALRIAGSGTPGHFQGSWNQRPCAILLYEDMLLLAPEGGDLQPFFLSLLQRISFDESTYVVRLTGWDGQTTALARLAGQTGTLLGAAKTARAVLSKEAGETAARHLPTLPTAARAVLSATWLPGRLMRVADLEKGCPGFTSAFRDSWIKASLREKEAQALLHWAGAEGTWAGFGRPGLGLEEPVTEDQAPGAETSEKASAQPTAEPPDCLLWLLCGKGDAWLLETLTEQNHATYRFAGGSELPLLASQLLCAPQFSREALYRPLEALTDERSGLAIAARELAFLRELRARFKGRAIHGSMDRWRGEAGVG